VALILGGWTLTLAGPQAVTASINGTVFDQTGAVVPEAKVMVKNVSTGLERETVTNQSGYYTIPLLPVGEYELTAEREGFAIHKRTGLKLTIGQILTLDLTLTAAGAKETVEVIADAPVVEVTRPSVASTVNDLAVANLPVNGRNFIDFVLLTPGVNRDHRGGDISFGGLRGTNNSLQIDGADNNNTFFGQTLGRTGSGRAPYQFSQDAVAEFQVNTNTYSAEFGRAGGAVINVVTKSGTNEWHGTVFEYYRDRSLNANDFFSNANRRRKPPFHINQFGGTIGGPIVKDKAFFFFNYDGQRQTLPNVVILGLPTNFQPNATEQQVLNTLQPLAQSYVRRFDQDVYMFKGDWQISAGNRFSGRYNRQKFTGGNLENSGQTSALEHTGDSLVTTDTITLSLTSTVTSRFVNDFRFQFARDKEPGKANSDNPEAEIRQAGQIVLTIGRNFFSPRETTIKRYQAVDTVSYLAGNHSLRFGVDINIDRIKNFFPGSFGGQYRFTSLAQFATGRPDSYVQAFAGPNTTGPLTFPDINEFAWFVQDDWRVTPRLTLNFGLRYDLQNIADPPVANPDAGLASLGLRTDRINLDTNNFGPRFGFAWNPLASNKLVIRGGYGFF
jgi:outer membrane receptor protein involved in Fe transport